MPELAVVVPTYSERDNVPLLLELLRTHLDGISWEVVFVDDDSPDGTATLARNLAQEDPRIRVLQRVGRRGLASACVEGMMATSAPFIGVMDADLQHDVRLLRPMLDALRTRPVDLVCGSRYLREGSIGDWTGPRRWMSRFATWVSHRLLRNELTDPMSGFFMVRREYLDRAVHNLSAQGFKIFLDLVTATRGRASVLELPYSFGQRQHGESKLDSTVALEFGLMMIEKRLPASVPLPFLKFVGVGGIGIVWHLFVMRVMLAFLEGKFLESQIVATVVAMTSNYWLNNVFTYRHSQLRGAAFFRGLLSFYIACSLGAVANVALADFLYRGHLVWWLSGIAGAAVGGVWNYAVTSTFTWGRRRR